MEAQTRIDQLVKDNKIMVFMKGNKLMPQCGFSNNVVQILNQLGVPFETFDVLADQEVRQGIKEYSNWPTIPQIYVNGEFLGGSDILIEMYQKNELQQVLEVALSSWSKTTKRADSLGNQPALLFDHALAAAIVSLHLESGL
jgi:monothiol glutaredoxin